MHQILYNLKKDDKFLDSNVQSHPYETSVLHVTCENVHYFKYTLNIK